MALDSIDGGDAETEEERIKRKKMARLRQEQDDLSENEQELPERSRR